MDRLADFGSWRLSKYANPQDSDCNFGDIFECRVKLKNGRWDPYYGCYGATIEQAIGNALTSPNRFQFVLSVGGITVVRD